MNKGMGRGLAAILPQPGDVGEPRLRDIPLAMIRPSADQPRRRFDPESIRALAASIAEAGMIQPVIVRPLPDGRYELIAGERRWRAAREAQLETVPALVRDEEGLRQLQIALIENVAREDLNPVDEARACATLLDDLGVSKEELARRLGRSRPALSNLVRLLDLPSDVLGLLESGERHRGAPWPGPRRSHRRLVSPRDRAPRQGGARQAPGQGRSAPRSGGDAEPS
jgi:ParB family chromosome partitioning protein